MKLTKIKEWWALTPPTQKRVLIIVIFIAVILISFLVLKPLYRSGSKKYQQANELKTEVRRLQEISKTIKSKEKSVQSKKSELEKLVSENSLKSSLLHTFSTDFASKNEGIEFLGIRPNKIQKGSTKKGKKSAPFIPMDISFRSDYPTIVNYMKYIESISNPYKVNSFNISMDPEVEGLLRVALNIRLFLQDDTNVVLEEKEKQTVAIDRSTAATEPSDISFVSKGGRVESTGLKDVALTLTGFVGDKALFGENLYAVGDSIQGWSVEEVSSLKGEVVLLRGEKKKIIAIGE